MRAASLPFPQRPAAAGAPIAHFHSSATVWGRRLLAAVLLLCAAGAALGFERALLALALLGFAAAVLGWVRPALALLGAGLLCVLDPLTRVMILEGGLLRWNTFNYLLVLVLLFSLPRLLRLREPAVLFAALLVLLLTAELLWSPDRMEGAQHVLGAVSFFGLLAYFIRAEADPGVWLRMAMVNGTAGAALGLLYFRSGDVATQIRQINANAWAYFPLTALFSICLSAAATPRAGRRILPVLAVVNFGWVFFSGSRGSLVLAVLCLGFLAVRLRGGAPRIALLGAAALAVVLAAGAFGSRESFALHRVQKLFDPEESMTERTSGRSDLARAAWRIFLEEPLMGTGTGGFAWRWARLETGTGLSTFGMGREMEAHSGWMKILAENGVPGFLLLSGFVASFAVSGWKRRSAGLWPAGLFVTAVLALALVSTEFQSKGVWFLAAGGVTLLRRGGIARGRAVPGTSPARGSSAAWTEVPR